MGRSKTKGSGSSRQSLPKYEKKLQKLTDIMVHPRYESVYKSLITPLFWIQILSVHLSVIERRFSVLKLFLQFGHFSLDLNFILRNGVKTIYVT